jgi:hypothetical protein
MKWIRIESTIVNTDHLISVSRENNLAYRCVITNGNCIYLDFSTKEIADSFFDELIKVTGEQHGVSSRTQSVCY